MLRITVFLFSYLISASIFAQAGVIKGNVTTSLSKEPIGYVPILVEDTTTGGTSYDNGEYTITGLEPGIKKGKEQGARGKGIVRRMIQN